MNDVVIKLKDVVESIKSHCKRLVEYYEQHPDKLDDKKRNPDNLSIDQLKQLLQSLSLQTIKENINGAKNIASKIRRNRDGKFNNGSDKANKQAKNKIKITK